MSHTRISRTKPPFPDFFWKRPLNYYSKSTGGVLAVMGSLSHTEPPLIVGEAIYRSGLGRVFVAHPDKTTAFYKDVIPGESLFPLASNYSGSISKAALPDILEESKSAAIVIIGPGISDNSETLHLCKELFLKLIKNKKHIIALDYAVEPALEAIKELGGGNNNTTIIIQARHHSYFRTLTKTKEIKNNEINFSLISKSYTLNIIDSGRGFRLYTADGRAAQTPPDDYGSSRDVPLILAGVTAAFLAYEKTKYLESLTSAAYIASVAIFESKKNKEENFLYRKSLRNISEVLKRFES